jgi:hypothetical protein
LDISGCVKAVKLTIVIYVDCCSWGGGITKVGKAGTCEMSCCLKLVEERRFCVKSPEKFPE